MTHSIQIGQRRIGGGEPVYIVAEMASNHDQRLDEAMRLLGAAKRAGADAVKLRSTMPEEWLPELLELAQELEMQLFAHPEAESPELLEGLDAPAYEIALTDGSLIQRAAVYGRPLILSTGDADPEQLTRAITTAREAGCDQLALVWRHAAFPAPASELRLRTIPRLRESFGVPVGFGDHTLGSSTAVAAVALGAVLLEKHLTLSRALPVAESVASLEPEEFARMVTAVRTAEEALGERIDADN